MTNKHHSTAAEARVRMRRQNRPHYDLIIADEFPPELDTELELYRHGAVEYPEVAVLELDPRKPYNRMSHAKEMLAQKPARERELERDKQRIRWATIIMFAGLTSIMFSARFQNTAEFILKNPPFTERFIIPETSPMPRDELKPLKEELLVPPPPETKPEINFDIHSVFTQELKVEMAKILANADEIINSSRVMTEENAGFGGSLYDGE